MPSPVAQMIIDLITNGQLDIADIQAIDQTATEVMIRANLAGQPVIGSAPTKASNLGVGTIHGTADIHGNPVEYGGLYRLSGEISPKHLRGITGKAIGKTPRSRYSSNRVEFEVDVVWRPRAQKFIDIQGRMSAPGSVLQKVK